MRNFKTPTTTELRDPILEILSDSKVWRFIEIVNEVADRFNLTEEDVKGDPFPSGFDRLPRYCAKVLVELEAECLVKRRPDLRRGYWQKI